MADLVIRYNRRLLEQHIEQSSQTKYSQVTLHIMRTMPGYCKCVCFGDDEQLLHNSTAVSNYMDSRNLDFFSSESYVYDNSDNKEIADIAPEFVWSKNGQCPHQSGVQICREK